MSMPLYKIVVGVRHKRMFTFSGNYGKLIDHLISKFPKIKNDKLYFSKLGMKNDNLGGKITNDLGNFELSFDIDGLVLVYNFYQDDTILPMDIIELFDSMLPDCLKLLEANKVVNRLGILSCYAFDNRNNAAADLSERLLKVDLNGLTDNFTLRFALKNPTENTLVRSDTLDFSNIIYTFNSEKHEDSTDPSNLIDLNIDYQLYYNPERNYIKGSIVELYNKYIKYITHDKVEKLINFTNEEGINGK